MFRTAAIPYPPDALGGWVVFRYSSRSAAVPSLPWITWTRTERTWPSTGARTSVRRRASSPSRSSARRACATASRAARQVGLLLWRGPRGRQARLSTSLRAWSTAAFRRRRAASPLRQLGLGACWRFRSSSGSCHVSRARSWPRWTRSPSRTRSSRAGIRQVGDEQLRHVVELGLLAACALRGTDGRPGAVTGRIVWTSTWPSRTNSSAKLGRLEVPRPGEAELERAEARLQQPRRPRGRA